MVKLLNLRPDSDESGLCVSCIHRVNDKCNTGKPCGQIMACRCQARAMSNGRYPSGRVRKFPPKRVKVEKGVKVSAWQETYKKMSELGDKCGCVWINFLSNSKQVLIRRLISKGEITAVYINGVESRKKAATFISVEDLNKHFDNWEVKYER